MIQSATFLMPKSGERRKNVEKQIGYFLNNAHRMLYVDFRAQGLLWGREWWRLDVKP
jgi:hypothetical protein